jgi:hypothetical protein
MRHIPLACVGLAILLSFVSPAHAQVRPYIGYAYPAGGQQGTTFRVRLGGQGLDGVDAAAVSGRGVTAKVVEYLRRLNNQEVGLLREQAAELKRQPSANDETKQLVARIESRVSEFVQTPACASLSSLVFLEITIAPDAEPGSRELTLATPRGVSNPLVFYVGQVPEVLRKPMLTALQQVLGKEELALRKRLEDEAEDRVGVPCTVNGQIASGEVNRYRFEARKGQRLVISTEARRLVPFIADAVPGWFQPVLSLSDARGKELAYSDDYQFRPDPVLLFEVPKDGEYVLRVADALYRGREDFVYRVTIGEMPLVTSIFPLGGRAGEPATIRMQGWNLDAAELRAPLPNAAPGVHSVFAAAAGMVSNRLPFALDTLPECLEKEPNNDAAHVQKVTLPIVVNGRVDRKDDCDVFKFSGRGGETVVAEVQARRLESPLDSILKLTDASGKLIAVNDDHDDPSSGANTHPADSYLMIQLPADGTYYLHLGDVARHGGDEYAYRLRISRPRPDFALFVVPSSVALRSKSASAVTIQAIRMDGFSGPIKIALTEGTSGFLAPPVTLAAAQTTVRLNVRTDQVETKGPVRLAIEGRAKIGGREVVRAAVPAEDRMQAFLWRHLVPAEELKAVVFNPSYEPPPKRVRIASATPTVKTPAPSAVDPATGKPKFTKQQVAGRLRQLKILYGDGLLTDDFYDRKVAECEAVQ